MTQQGLRALPGRWSLLATISFAAQRSEFPPNTLHSDICRSPLGTSEHPTDFLAILPIALLGTATVLLTFLIGKTLAGERVLRAGFFVATMSGFFILHRRCLVDPTLLFFTTLSLYGFIAGYQATGKRFRFFAVFYLAMAGAFLSKGLIGIAIPVGTAVVFLIARKDFATVRRLYLGRELFFFFSRSFYGWPEYGGSRIWRGQGGGPAEREKVPLSNG